MEPIFLKACRREKTPYTPIWIMRQAGRYLKEYRAIREKYSFLTMCKTPELILEITKQPVELIGVDAAILFSDILIPAEAMGIKLDFFEGKGPVLSPPVRSEKEVEALRIPEPEEELSFVLEGIKLLRKELPPHIALIGFAGAPFTVASYLVEGSGSKNFAEIKKLMYNQPQLFSSLLEKVTRTTEKYLKAQIRAGAQAVQIFESWAGALSPSDYQKYVLPFSKKLIASLKEERVPIIHFANGASTYLHLIKETEATVYGVDWHIELNVAWEILGEVAIQGNLDPIVLLAEKEVVEEKAKEVLQKAHGKPGHIFNLGHGILPQTPAENAKRLVEVVHQFSQN